MASMLVSGKAALQTNSDRHFTASWNESIAAAKCSRKVFTEGRVMSRGNKDMNKRLMRLVHEILKKKVLIVNHSFPLPQWIVTRQVSDFIDRL